MSHITIIIDFLERPVAGSPVKVRDLLCFALGVLVGALVF